ncbi:MAG: phenazine biosynthesis protein PhzF family [Lysobacterales bacterium 69-70]|nr:PhzF family phenazine biosynthesis protein [Xanthomonadaceae bacterium]ODU34001.1 MAG: phenazine biosynthesis protein PhzF family [Xanthomonadaceae bacterium SCN 69-320]ODV18697.1 MAG: phenazine biosynthesis protein PhzF family [Xanthomonadaceae bacterium SCN 69-25]OJY93100.1 MAG: phenazine biosynthesis protein PhzF family [Xanthomonadales bacterium 69-70]
MDDARYLQLDVFAEKAGGGNPLGVVIGAQDWDDTAMQRFARWTGLVETTFLLPPTRPEASYRARIFTPQREIAFAGHPTIGSAHAALETGFVTARGDGLIQECGAGLLPIHIGEEAGRRVLSVQAPRARRLEPEALHAKLVRAILDRTPLGALPPGFVEGGRRWWIAEFADEATLRGWQPDHAAIARLAKASDSLGLCVFARCRQPDYEIAVRAFPAGVGIDEDPASGAANGLIGAWIAAGEPQGPLARGYRVSQGREIGHDARLGIRIESDGAVWVGGVTHTVIDGHARWS